MFLFETFTYNEEWAKKHYGLGNIHSAWSWLDDVLRDPEFIKTLKTPEERQRYIFSVSKIDYFESQKNLYEIYMYHDKGSLDEEQKEYIINRLRALGDAIKIISTNYRGHVLVSYDIEKDEYRWNLAHQRIQEHEDRVDAVNINEPNIEDWMFMLDSYYNQKNPRLIFKKMSDNNKLMRLYVIACKLNWNAAKVNIKSIMCFQALKDVKNSYEVSNLQAEACEKYAKTYEPDEDIQELIDDYKGSYKSQKNIPVKAKPIAALLDQDSYFKDYSIYMFPRSSQYDPLFDIEAQTADGKNIWIVIKHHNGTYYIDAYENRTVIEKFGFKRVQYDNQINKHMYYATKINFGKTRMEGTLKSLLDTWWNQLVNDIKEYKIKED